MKPQPLIMLTNDDGVDSAGLRAAAEAVLGVGEIMVVAPRLHQSAAGRSVTGVGSKVWESSWTLSSPTGEQAEIPVYALDSSPAQVIRYGVTVLAKRKPDLVISGINYGENLGLAITVSGTVGAALEAASAGISALAVSLEMDREEQARMGRDKDFAAARVFTRRLAEIVLRRGPLPGVDLFKVDIPHTATTETPWRLTRLAKERYIYPTADGIGYEAKVNYGGLEPDSDIYAIFVDKVVSVTPLTLDLTARADFESLSQLFNSS